jgi:hypothetical protein
MVYHILNGDSLAYSFPEAKIPGELIVAREGLIDGDLSGTTLNEFWEARAKYMGRSQSEYDHSVVTEFEKIMKAGEDAEFNLWFEYDLFCQVNMWFVISIINSLSASRKVFAVYTTYLDRSDKQFWNGFGPATAATLIHSFADRILLDQSDLEFGQDLWEAYKNADLSELSRLSTRQSTSFPYIKEVIQAHLERFPKEGGKGRPERVLEDITQNVSTDFQTVFREFWKRESIYGFGDIQLKHLYDKVMHRL